MKKNKKQMILQTVYDTFLDTEYRTLKNIQADLTDLIQKYGEDADLFSGRNQWGDREAYISFARLETDEELAERLRREAKAVIDAKRNIEIQEANERALFLELKKKYEVSPDESK